MAKAKAKAKPKAAPKAKKASTAALLDGHRDEAIKLQEEYFRRKLAAECQLYDAVKKVKEGKGDFVLLDARDPDSYNAGHIPGAKNVPTGDIDRIKALDKEKSYVAYCWNHTCHLAPTLALQLSELGYHCRELNAGWEEWTAQKLPVEKTESVAVS